MKEYWAAIHCMGEDILQVKSENARLSEELNRLISLSGVDATELEGCCKLELIYKLSRSSTENTQYFQLAVILSNRRCNPM